ncbi:hypothetical protein ACVWZR_004794 [Bradyrhizobium sp. i1.3.1]
MDMGVGMIVSMRMPVAMRMVMGLAMNVVVVMRAWDAAGTMPATLYYNITPVHGRLKACRSPSRWLRRRTGTAPRRRSGTRRTGPA